MAIRNRKLKAGTQLVYGKTAYVVGPDGLLDNLPANVEKALLELANYEPVAAAPAAPKVEEAVQAPAPAPKVDVVDVVNEIASATGQSPDEIRAAIAAAINAARPRDLKEAMQVGRDKLFALTDGTVPDWMTTEERAGLGLVEPVQAPMDPEPVEAAPVVNEAPASAPATKAPRVAPKGSPKGGKR